MRSDLDSSYIFVPDNVHEGPVLWEMIGQFVSVTGIVGDRMVLNIRLASAWRDC